MESKKGNILLIILVVALLSSVSAAGYLYFRGQMPSFKFQSAPVAPTSAVPNVNSIDQPNEKKPTPKWGGKLLVSKSYGNFKVGSYVIDDMLGGAFIVAPIENKSPTVYRGAYALSYAIDVFATDNLFDIVGDKIYIINQKVGFIDVYTARFVKSTEATSSFYTMDYTKTINGPKYEVGVPNFLKCQNDSCQLKTVIHQQSGCQMLLNISTEQYSEIKCAGMGGSFDPVPI